MNILSMAVRMVMRRLVSRGVNAGIDRVFGSQKAPQQMTAEERRRHEQSQANAKRSRQAIRVARRFGRF